jgi:hypothetical protein
MKRRMHMGIWELLFAVGVAGGTGGLVSALVQDSGFTMPYMEHVTGKRIIHPGTFGNVIVGGLAAAFSWAFYGPLSQAAVITQSAPSNASTVVPAAALYNLSLASLAGAFIIGIGGARYLAAQLDTLILKTAAVKATLAKPDANAAANMIAASPQQTLEIAKKLSTDIQ